jgi:formate C-acetyltransferase
MRSNLKLDQAEAPDGHIIDVMLPLSMTKRPTAAQDIATILATYFKRGGQCLHLNCFDSALLREATAHPEKYPDLQVRVCGWNVKWNDLSPQEKRHFIATTEALE